jgi:hypothetical protein
MKRNADKKRDGGGVEVRKYVRANPETSGENSISFQSVHLISFLCTLEYSVLPPIHFFHLLFLSICQAASGCHLFPLITWCVLLNSSNMFGGTNTLIMKAVSTSKTSVNVNKLHGATSQKPAILNLWVRPHMSSDFWVSTLRQKMPFY